MVAEEIFANCYNLILLFKSKKEFSRYLTKLSGAGSGAGARARAGAAILICGSEEPEPEEIFSAPKYW